MRSVSLLVTALLMLAGCGSAPVADTLPTPTPSVTADLPDEGPLSVLDLVPMSATDLTLTDWDKVRTRFGVPDLTSDDLMADRSAFWEQADADAVLLADGMLREDSSSYELDHGFTQDDVDIEAHWTGPDGAGFALVFRPDQDMAEVRGALDTPALRGATIDGHVVVRGAAQGQSWAEDATWNDLTDPEAETAYLRRGCTQLADALGPDADVEDLDAVTSKHAVDNFEELAAWSIAFADGVAAARLGLNRGDVIERAHLGDDWPSPGPIGFDDAFTSMVNDTQTGRIGYQVGNPRAAAGLTLLGELPFTVCPDVTPLPSPSGL